MSVARVTELSATSEKSFEDAIDLAISSATQTLRGVEGCWVKDMNVLVSDGNIRGYNANVAITFQLEDAQGTPSELEQPTATTQGTGGEESTGA